jgi:hypothetical protein
MDIRGYVTISETRKALREIYRQDSETNLHEVMRRALADDLKPVDDKGRWRPSALLILASVIVGALIATFAYFSIGARI